MILGPPLVDVVQAVFLFEIIAFLCLSLIRMMKKMAIKSDSPLAGHGISIHGPTESGSGEAAPARPMIRARVYTLWSFDGRVFTLIHMCWSGIK
jgi:hypothetical protein